jgi:putative solute:sodium symporter small subunit
MSDQGVERARAAYWRKNLRLLVGLLAVWFGCSFGLGILLVEPLDRIHVGGFPLGFWFAQQGSIYIFIVLILVYARRMDRVDAEYARDAAREAADGPSDGIR